MMKRYQATSLTLLAFALILSRIGCEEGEKMHLREALNPVMGLIEQLGVKVHNPKIGGIYSIPPGADPNDPHQVVFEHVTEVDGKKPILGLIAVGEIDVVGADGSVTRRKVKFPVIAVKSKDKH